MQGIQGVPSYVRPLGVGKIDATTGVKTVADMVDASGAAMAVPPGAAYVIIQAQAAGISYTDDGQTPTATFGIQIASGNIVQYNSKFDALKFIKISGLPQIGLAFYGKGA